MPDDKAANRLRPDKHVTKMPSNSLLMRSDFDMLLSLSHGSVLGSDPDSSPSDECEGECLEFDVDLFICTSVTLSLLFSGLTDDSEALESSRPSLASSWSDALLMEDCNMQKVKTIRDYVQQSSHH